MWLFPQADSFCQGCFAVDSGELPPLEDYDSIYTSRSYVVAIGNLLASNELSGHRTSYHRPRVLLAITSLPFLLVDTSSLLRFCLHSFFSLFRPHLVLIHGSFILPLPPT
jgi:hypothetical protein